ncbi:MAG: leucine-rich repeat protein, partial [Lachnotalea sp.]
MSKYKYSVKALAAFLAVVVMVGGIPVSALAATNENTAEVVNETTEAEINEAETNEAETNEDTAEVTSKMTVAEPNEDITQVTDEATEVTTDEIADKAVENIMAFVVLPEDIANQTVLYGTVQEELNLPDTVTVTLQNDSEGEETNSTETKEQEISVNWKASPSYDSEAPGTYGFTPVIEEFEVNTELPVITVKVEEKKTEEVSLQQNTVEANPDTASVSGWKITGTKLTIESDAGMSSWIANSTTSQKKSIESVEIFDGVNSIGEKAFARYCENLESIVIPSSVKSIGYAAFNYCTKLTNISIPNGVGRIEAYTFNGCTNLKSLVIPSSVTSIGENALARCGLTSIEIPSSVKEIEKQAFNQCKDMTKFMVDNPSSMTSIGENALASCGLTSVEIPSSVTNIGIFAFSDCKMLTSVEIPNSITCINKGVFCGSGLTSVVIPSSVTSIENIAFSGCSSLTNVEIPSSATSIGDSAFSDCSSLLSIQIPSNVTSIGENAFGQCDRLEELIFWGENPPDIGKYAFHIFNKYIIYVPKDSVERYQVLPSFEDCKIYKHINSSVTVNQGNGTGDYDKYVTVTIEAEPDTDTRVFDSWSVSDGVTLNDPSSRKTTFVMPGKNVTITSNYKYINNGNVMIRGNLDFGLYSGNGKVNNGNILDGLGEPAGNTLTFNSESGVIAENSSFFGGYDESGVNVTDNTVNVNGGTFSNSNVIIYGGFQNTKDSGDVTDNTVNLNEFSGTLNTVCGGSSREGTANNNQITMNIGEVQSIIGGNSDKGNSSNNSVTITGGKVDSQIYGGQIHSGNKSAINNTVTLSGDANIAATVGVFGGYSSDNNNVFKGNTLNLDQVVLNIGIISNFQYINFTVPASLKDGDTVITTSVGASLYDLQTNEDSTINISVDSDCSLEINDQVTLIDASAGKLYVSGLDGTTVSDDTSGYEFRLNVESNNLIATVINISYKLNVTNGSGSGTYKGGDSVTITASEAQEGLEFDCWTSDSGITFDNAHNITTKFTMPAKAVSVTAKYRIKKVTEISLSQTSADLKVGNTLNLNATVTPINAIDKSVTWSSNNIDIVTVDQNGLAIAKGVGSAVITVTSNSNVLVSATCTINVATNIVTATGLTLSQTNVELKAGNNIILSATITPANVTNSGVTWSSSNKDIATVDENGTITAKGIGSSVITVTSNSNASVSATCSINVSIGKVTGLTAKKNNTTSITLTWEKQNNVKGYVVYRYDSAKKKYV